MPRYTERLGGIVEHQYPIVTIGFFAGWIKGLLSFVFERADLCCFSSPWVVPPSDALTARNAAQLQFKFATGICLE
jgi:hypothetical protein